ncbi:SGL domain containing protein [Asbolus verrucosus]|uniref:Regucalcin n=1 Tax=Asbolus verrucosus TaxID=1661398 RepID=A0A482VWB7_ASBVE|nr:SGL domain containing protein [Asbolus verrucosus]
MAPKVERIIDSVELGEGPHWDVESQSLYFVDIYGKAIHRYIPATKKHTKAVIGTNHVSFIIPVEGQKNKFLLGIGRDLAVVTWDGESEKVSNVEKIYEVDNTPETLNNRFNDAKCDASGRLWAGTMGAQPVNGYVEPHKGRLISMGPKNQITTHLTKVGISNGLAWSSDNKYFYYIDTHKGTVDQYDFDIKSGTISNCKPIFTLNKTNISGGLDGMTIDTDGNLWVAIFGGNRVIKIDPRNPETLLQTISIPACQVTSVVFGGPNLDQLYVTSAALTTDGVEFPPPDHGATYVITGTGVKGSMPTSQALTLLFKTNTNSTELGEGPHWDCATQSLYFVDIFGKSIHRYVPATKKHTTAVIGTSHVSIIIPVEGEKNKFVISLGRRLATIKWDGESKQVSDITTIGEVDDDPDTLGNRFNDGKCDPHGTLWVGTMGAEPTNGHVKPNKGGLFSLGPNKQLKKHLSHITISNGLAWNTDLGKFYYIDSPKRTIDEFDVDFKHGTDRKPIFSLDKHNIPGFPDGMAIDTDGNLWVAIFNGYRVIKIDPRNPETLLQTIEIPAKQVDEVTLRNEPLGFAFPVEGHDDQFIAGLGRKLVLISWDGVSDSVNINSVITEVDTDGDLSDEHGQTIPGRGSLYSLTNGKLRQHVKGIGISNGTAFDTSLKKMYYIDTLFPGIFQFDYDGEKGEISNKKIIFRFEDNSIEGLPDGLTIDQDGNLWATVLYGSAVVKVDPRTGALLQKIDMPTSQITAVTWGNKNLDVMYVNTAKMAVNGKVPDKPAGCTFKMENLGEVKGLPGTEPLSFAFPVEGHDDTFIAALGRNFVLIRWDGVSDSVCTCNIIAEADKNIDLSSNRVNGGKVDPYGRLWAGTMGPPDENGKIIPGREIGISNGIAFDTALKKMYYIDTLFRGIFQFDYDGENGEIDNKKIVFQFEDNCIEGSPDGLTIDTDGNLWVAVIFGSAVIKVDPRTGILLKKIEMPTSQITALTWGNRNLNVMYVNSAKMAVNGKIPDEPAGCTFKMENLGVVKGLPGDRYKL